MEMSIFLAFKSAIEIENFRLLNRKKVYCNFCFAQKMKICLKYSDNKIKSENIQKKIDGKKYDCSIEMKNYQN